MSSLKRVAIGYLQKLYNQSFKYNESGTHEEPEGRMFKKFLRESVFEPTALGTEVILRSTVVTETASSSKTGIGSKDGSGELRKALEEK